MLHRACHRDYGVRSRAAVRARGGSDARHTPEKICSRGPRPHALRASPGSPDGSRRYEAQVTAPPSHLFCGFSLQGLEVRQDGCQRAGLSHRCSGHPHPFTVGPGTPASPVADLVRTSFTLCIWCLQHLQGPWPTAPQMTRGSQCPASMLLSTVARQDIFWILIVLHICQREIVVSSVQASSSSSHVKVKSR